MTAPAPRPGRFGWLYVAPCLLLLVVFVAPLVLGGQTLYYRDVLSTHYPLKAAQAALFEAGQPLPLVDPFRGGQALVGNPNAVVLYPGSLLLAAADPLWATNAHFWIHLLLAPWAGFWLGRAWGLSRPGAWAVGVTYASSGFFLSLMNLYNMVAGAALLPAFVAAGLDAAAQQDRRRGRRLWVLAAALWGLILLAGDPSLAAMAAAMATTALWARHGRRAVGRPLGGLLLAGAGGLLLAAPQIVEFLRILPRSARGYWRTETAGVLTQSWHPATLLEQLSPLLFGGAEAGYWGLRFHGGHEPLIHSLHLGWGVLALAAAGLARGALGRWGWGWAGGGALLSLGAYGPFGTTLAALPGATLLRYPVRLWLVVTVAACLLAGAGFDALRSGRGGRRYLAVLGAGWVTVSAALVGLVLPGAPSASALAALAPDRLTPEVLPAEAYRWSISWGLLWLTLGALLGLYLLRRRAPGLGLAATLVVHLGSQLLLLGSLLDTDEAAFYRRPPAAAARLPADGLTVHSATHALFGGAPGRRRLDLDQRRLAPRVRERAEELSPAFGIRWGQRYELASTPEGLDSFFTVALRNAFPRASDAQRVRLLQASGVDALIAPRPVEHPDLEPLAPVPAAAGRAFLYRLGGAAAPYQLAQRIHPAANMTVGVDRMASPAFDPRRDVLLPTADAAHPATGGRVRVLAERPERVELEVESPGGAVLLASERAWLPLWRAAVDGRETRVLVANIHRLGVAVPAGRHRVQLWVDRGPTRAALATSAVAALLLGLVWIRRGATP